MPFGLLVLALAAYPVIPLDGVAEEVVYDAIAVAALGVALAALLRRRPTPSTGWVLVLAGYGLWLVGDLVWTVERYVVGAAHFPSASDVPYLAAYGLLAAGAQSFSRSRLSRRDLTALLDAAILAAGVAVPAVVFVVLPAAADSSLTGWGKVISSAYPLGDILVLAVVVRLVLAHGALSWSLAGLVGSLTSVFAADLWWNGLAIGDPTADPLGTDVLWLAGYVLLAGAVLHPSMLDLAEAPAGRDRPPSGGRLTLLTLGSLLPAATLLFAGVRGGEVPWLPVSVGGALLTFLVVLRMAGLLDQVRQQSVQLTALARSDELTGAPNRRTWDHELSRACAVARDRDTPLCVAIVDLDHFKHYNDRFGHPAGDRLLREAVAAWTEALGPAGMLARYGGEEFTLLLPGTDVAEAAARVDVLRAVTPGGQTFSAGVARWEPGTEPGDVLEAADKALYAAKRGGRDRVEVAGGLAWQGAADRPLQPVQVSS